jgi:hypothetical protein
MIKQKNIQEFTITLKPSTVIGDAPQGQTELHVRERFTSARMEGATRVAPARAGAGHDSDMALLLFQKNAFIDETDKLQGPCVVRTTEGLHAGKLNGHHGTPESMCVIIADLKPLAGRTLVMARLGAIKTKLARKYEILATQAGSIGRRAVLRHKVATFRTEAQTQWMNLFRTLALPVASRPRQRGVN